MVRTVSDGSAIVTRGHHLPCAKLMLLGRILTAFAERWTVSSLNTPSELRAFAVIPKDDDIILTAGRTEAEEIYLLDALTRERLADPFGQIAHALREARRLRPAADLWHESIDNRGRPLGPLSRLIRA